MGRGFEMPNQRGEEKLGSAQLISYELVQLGLELGWNGRRDLVISSILLRPAATDLCEEFLHRSILANFLTS